MGIPEIAALASIISTTLVIAEKALSLFKKKSKELQNYEN
jgi:hypothetical protein